MIVSGANLNLKLGSGGVKRIVIVALVTFLAASVSFACDNDADEASDGVLGTNSTAQVGSGGGDLADKDTADGSRAMGGIPVK